MSHAGINVLREPQIVACKSSFRQCSAYRVHSDDRGCHRWQAGFATIQEPFGLQHVLELLNVDRAITVEVVLQHERSRRLLDEPRRDRKHYETIKLAIMY